MGLFDNFTNIEDENEVVNNEGMESPNDLSFLFADETEEGDNLFSLPTEENDIIEEEEDTLGWL